LNEAEQMSLFDRDIWCGKMCPELSAPTKEPISASCSKKPQKWPANKPPLFLSLKTDGLQPDALPMWEDNGALRGEYLMHSFGVCPKDENASHLSQILEASPHPKYYLSARACRGILNRAEKRGKQLPEILKLALIQQVWQDGKAPALRAQSGDNQPAIALENHPADGRVKIAEDKIVQTLSARMGTGGGNVPLVMSPYQKVIGSLCARDSHGVCNQYVQEDKLIVAREQK